MSLTRTSTRYVWAFLILAALVTRPGSTSAAATWNIVASPNAGSRYNDLVGVAASTSADVWAVGTSANQTGPYRSLAEHWDGASWKIVATPNVGASHNFLNGVAAVATNDAWAVGQSLATQYLTLTEHWDGTAWSVVSSPNVGSGGNVLNAVAAVSPTSVWAVGQNGKSQTLIEHWNGTSWSIVASPNVGSDRNSLAAIAVISASDIWAVGQFGQEAATLTEHWNGMNWSVVPSPHPGTGENQLFSVTAISSSDVWSVGSQAHGTQTLAVHWNGTTWTTVPTPNPVGPSVGNSYLSGVTALASGDVWSVGTSLNFVAGSLQQTIAEQWNGMSWSVVGTPNSGSGSNTLNKATATSGGSVWAVGHFTPPSGGPQQTLILENTRG